jgi:alpha-glucoside transport system permease protein
VLAVAALEFIQVWNDLVVALLVGGSGDPAVTLVLASQAREFTTSSGLLAATAVTIMIVPLGLVLAAGRWVVQGLAAGVAR